MNNYHSIISHVDLLIYTLYSSHNSAFQDGLKICLGISKNDPLQQERIELLSRIHLPPVGEYQLKAGPELMSKSLLGFLKIFCMNKDELDFCLKSGSPKDSGKDEDYILALPIQGDIYNFLKTRLELLLRNYQSCEQVKCLLIDNIFFNIILE